jgi:hypothetical protein
MDVIKNIISKDIAEQLENIIINPNFCWNWSNSSKHGRHPDGELSEDFQFIHNISKPSELYNYVEIILNKFQKITNKKIKDIKRVKLNLLPRQKLTDQGLSESIHIDSSEPNTLTIIYYVTDSDGDTVLYEGDNIIKSVTPKRGSILYFPSNIKHRATPPTINKRRVVLNIVVEL